MKLGEVLKKKLALTLFLAAVLFSGAIALALGGTLKDPLISLEYLSNTFRTSILAKVDKQINDAYTQSYENAEKKLIAEVDLYRTIHNGDSDSWSFSSQISLQKRSLGDTVHLTSGSSLLFIEGAATANAQNGELIDVTQGTSAASLSLSSGNRYLVGEGATVTITVKSDAAIFGTKGYFQSTVSGEAAMPFTDISQNAWYYDSARFAYQKKLLNGVSADHFSPGDTVTRAMLATILYRLAGEPGLSGTEDTFSDINSGLWYETGVRWASVTGIVNGMGNGTYKPNANVSREQLALMLYRYATEYKKQNTNQTGDLSHFADHLAISPWAEQGLSWAVGAGIMNGDTNGKLDPSGSASRAEAAAMLQRFSNMLS